ncbi:hypothetical protein Y032_0107g3829 [Ancylostoma ceylanicum]|uniref:Uncharacterized protein n=1 Tax=Ancylostoma ceylanicum TaxID=53326 RepID=A0A016TFL4_9BILA|nr:hypothetical protein Y032_0107g3829 [Ancylostoma ceylanicum]
MEVWKFGVSQTARLESPRSLYPCGDRRQSWRSQRPAIAGRRHMDKVKEETPDERGDELHLAVIHSDAGKPSDNNFNLCMMPTKEQVEATPGTPLTKEELARLQAEGQLPQGMDPSLGAPTLHRMKSGDQEFLVHLAATHSKSADKDTAVLR